MRPYSDTIQTKTEKVMGNIIYGTNGRRNAQKGDGE